MCANADHIDTTTYISQPTSNVVTRRLCRMQSLHEHTGFRNPAQPASCQVALGGRYTISSSNRIITRRFQERFFPRCARLCASLINHRDATLSPTPPSIDLQSISQLQVCHGRAAVSWLYLCSAASRAKLVRQPLRFPQIDLLLPKPERGPSLNQRQVPAVTPTHSHSPRCPPLYPPPGISPTQNLCQSHAPTTCTTSRAAPSSYSPHTERGATTKLHACMRTRHPHTNTTPHADARAIALQASSDPPPRAVHPPPSSPGFRIGGEDIS